MKKGVRNSCDLLAFLPLAHSLSAAGFSFPTLGISSTSHPFWFGGCARCIKPLASPERLCRWLEFIQVETPKAKAKGLSSGGHVRI